MNPLNYFWTWFSQNQKHFLNYLKLSPKLQKHFTFWMEWHLNYYANGVGYVIVFPKKKNQKNKLIITAYGKSKNFEKVEAVVAAAPRFNNWEIIAFVQQTANIDEMVDGIDKPFIFQDISLKASTVKFEPIEYKKTKKIDLIIYLKYETITEDYNDLMKIVYIMVESILGEKFLHENINFVQLRQMPIEDDINLIHLYELMFYIDDINKSN